MLLVFGNHSSHNSLQAFEFCKEHSIIVVSLPPHTSNKTHLWICPSSPLLKMLFLVDTVVLSFPTRLFKY